MIKAVIFDCFGVLVTENWLPFKKKYFQNDPQLFQEATELGRQLNAGIISYDDFIKGVARRAQVSEAETLQEIDGNVANEELFEYIAQTLKPKFRIGLLSNIGDNWLSEMFTEQQLALFDEITLSYKVGILKPDLRAYTLIADQLNVKPGECVFVDDKERHCAGARAAGMQAILYADFDQMKSELEELLAR